jgi:hypothetical protein
MTRQGATKALHALESLSAQIERKRPQPAPIADWSSLEVSALFSSRWGLAYSRSLIHDRALVLL